MKKTGIIIGVLILIVISLIVYIALGNKKTEDKYKGLDVSSTSTKNINFDPLNFTYEIEGEKITLVNGTSTVDVVPGSAEKLETTTFSKPAIGDLNNDKKNDSALLLVQDSGGTGLFYYVVAIVNDAGVIKNTNSIFIGDRIEPVSLDIKDQKIQLNYIDRNPSDPMTADPTVRVTKYFEIKNGELVEVK